MSNIVILPGGYKAPKINVLANCWYTPGLLSIHCDFEAIVPEWNGDPTTSAYGIVCVHYGPDGSLVDSYQAYSSPAIADFSTSSALAAGAHEMRCYCMPEWNSTEPYTAGEIVCHDSFVCVCLADCTNVEPTPYAPEWHMLDAPELPSELSAIDLPGYLGISSSHYFGMTVAEPYEKFVDFKISYDVSSGQDEVDIWARPDVHQTRFTFVAWLFDISGYDGDVTPLILSDSSSQYPIQCSEYDIKGHVKFEGLSPDTRYGALVMAVPEFRYGEMYMPGDIVYYNGAYWQVDPALSIGVLDPPAESSPQTWICISADNIETDYWAYWWQYSYYSSGYNSLALSIETSVASSLPEIDLSHSYVNAENASFALYRTNVALTGNVALTVAGDGTLWFDSIDSNAEMTKDQYKHVPVISNWSHPANMHSFFNKGKTPNDSVFGIKIDVDPTVVSSKFEDQHDSSLYVAGARYLASKYYDEKFSFFAPIYVKDIVPDYFVIYKVRDPLNERIDLLRDSDYDPLEYMRSILGRAVLVKSFYIGQGTRIGDYMRALTKDALFPRSPLDVDFSKDGMTYWNGALISSGTWGSRGEMLGDMYSEDNVLKHFEKYMTDGYARNGVVFPNILNMQFLFDDDTSSDFDFNRYIGFYVDFASLEQFDVDAVRYGMEQYSYGNVPVFFDAVKSNSDVPRAVSNASGVILPYAKIGAGLNYADFENSADNCFICCVKDKNDTLHGVHSSSAFSYDMYGNTRLMRLSDTSADMSDFWGTSDIFLQDRGTIAAECGMAATHIKVLSALSNYDIIRIYHEAGSASDAYGKYDDITVFSDGGSPGYLSSPGDYYAGTNNYSPPAQNQYHINGNALHGSVSPIVSAICACVNSMPNRSFEAIGINDTVFLKAYAASYANSAYFASFNSPVAGNYSSVNIGGYTGQNLQGIRVPFAGGTDTSNRIIISAKHMPGMVAYMSDVLVRTARGWADVICVSNYSDSIVDGLDHADADAAYAAYFANVVVAISGGDAPDMSDGCFLIKRKAHAEFGMLSFYNLRDFDYDYHSSAYCRRPYWEYYKHLSIPPDTDVMRAGVRYVAISKNADAVISYGGSEITLLKDTLTPIDATEGYSGYSVISGDDSVFVYVAYPYGYSGMDPSVCQPSDSPQPYGSSWYDDNRDMDSFGGFFVMRSENPAQSQAAHGDLPAYASQYESGIVGSEYDCYRENYTRDFAFFSKTQPYACKWGYDGGRDARDNPYRLNCNSFFGESNFSPSHTCDLQDPSRLTHEWLYLVANYDGIVDDAVLADNYCFFQNDIDLDAVMSVYGEFERYFTYAPASADGRQVGRTQHRYSYVRYNASVDRCETFYRGAKMALVAVAKTSSGEVVRDALTNRPVAGDSRHFDGYKFAAVLRVVKEDMDDFTQPPIRARFMEQPEFKFVLFVVDVALGHAMNVNGYLSVPISRADINWLYHMNDACSRVDGDYRIGFSHGVSDMTYSFMYGAKNKKAAWNADVFSTVRIPSLFSYDIDGFFIDRDYNESRSAYANYECNLQSDMAEYGGNIFAPYVFAARYFDDVIFNDYPNYVTQRKLRTPAGQNFSYSIGSGVFLPSADELSAYRQVAAGRKHYEKFMRRLSFASIASYINGMGPNKDFENAFIEYETFGGDNGSFFASVFAPSAVEKNSAIVALPDSNVPDKLQQIPVIGYSFARGKLQNAYDIYRYGGGYSPIFRDVLLFERELAFAGNPSMPVMFDSNVSFAPTLPGFGTIGGAYHVKVADSRILTLQNDPKFYPAYELINEIAVGYSDQFVLLSSWDYGYHKKYVSRDRRIDVAGSLRVKEDACFVNKVLSLPSQSNILNYPIPQPHLDYDAKVSYEPVLVDDIDTVDMRMYCFAYAYYEREKEYRGRINLSNAIVHKFKKDGISAKFYEFLMPSDQTTLREYVGYDDLDDYVTAYVEQNVIDLYFAYDMFFYSKKTDGSSGDFSVEYHDDSVLADSTWSVDKDIKINKYSGTILSFKIAKQQSGGIILSPVIKIKLI